MYQEYLNQLEVSIAPLSSDELKDLLNNDEKLDEKVDAVLEVLRAQKNMLFEENRTKAELNIQEEPRIIELRSKISELMSASQTHCNGVQEKLVEIKGKSGNVSQETALALLQTAAAESEEETEALVKKFTDNVVGVETFLEEFLAARKTMHLRKLKAEKMQELMRRQGQQQGARGPAYPYGNMGPSGFYPPPPVGGGVPYPMGPMMPMPPTRPY